MVYNIQALEADEKYIVGELYFDSRLEKELAELKSAFDFTHIYPDHVRNEIDRLLTIMLRGAMVMDHKLRMLELRLKDLASAQEQRIIGKQSEEISMILELIKTCQGTYASLHIALSEVRQINSHELVILKIKQAANILEKRLISELSTSWLQKGRLIRLRDELRPELSRLRSIPKRVLRLKGGLPSRFLGQ